MFFTTGKLSISYSIEQAPISRKCNDMFSGKYNDKICIFKFHKNITEAENFYRNYGKLGFTKYVPIFEGPLALKHNSFSISTCFKIRYTSIFSVFVSKRKEFSKLKLENNKPKIWMPFIMDTYRSVFTSVVRGLLYLFSYGITVPNLRSNCTVIVDEKGNYEVAFLELTSFEDFGMVNCSILDLVSLMKDVAGLIGPRFDHPFVGTPADITNFLRNVDSELLNFLNDPQFVLFDPFVYTPEEKLKRNTEIYHFIDTCPVLDELDYYFRLYPTTWNEWIDRNSFVDVMITDWSHKKAKEKEQLMEKVHLENVLEKVKLNLENGMQCKKIQDVKACLRMGLEESEKKFKKTSPSDEILSTYSKTQGFRRVPKISWNIIQRYNDHAKAHELPLETLNSILDKVDDAFDCTCSHFHWFFVNVWRSNPGAVTIHKSIFLGKFSWTCDAVQEYLLCKKDNESPKMNPDNGKLRCAVEDGKWQQGPCLDSCDEGQHKKPKLEGTGWTEAEPSEANPERAIGREKVSFKFKKG